jgi:hypothetical protein
VEATDGTGGEGTFTLRGVDQNVTAFTDRPTRLARRIPVETVVSSWADAGFGDDPPNASLAFERDGVEQVQAVTLMDPVVDGDEITFTYTPLTSGAPLVVGARIAELPAEFQSASLFIDASGSTLGRSIGLGAHEDPSLYLGQDIYGCGSATCWGVLYGSNLSEYAAWQVLYEGSDSPIVSGTADIEGNVNEVELTLPCTSNTASAYAADRDDEVSTESYPTPPPGGC